MASHREKAVEAFANWLATTQGGWGGGPEETIQFDQACRPEGGMTKGFRSEARAALQAAEPHLQRMYWERFSEAVLSLAPAEQTGHQAKRNRARLLYALDKAKDLMEESK